MRTYLLAQKPGLCWHGASEDIIVSLAASVHRVCPGRRLRWAQHLSVHRLFVVQSSVRIVAFTPVGSVMASRLSLESWTLFLAGGALMSKSRQVVRTQTRNSAPLVFAMCRPVLAGPARASQNPECQT
jgi:hypothetical protein